MSKKSPIDWIEANISGSETDVSLTPRPNYSKIQVD